MTRSPDRGTLCMLTTRHEPNDDRIYYKEALSLRDHFPRLVMVAPRRRGQAVELSRAEFFPLERRDSPLGRFMNILEAVRAVRIVDPDVCHVHDLDLILALPLLRWLTRAKLVYDSHEAYWETLLITPRLPARARPLVARMVDLLEKRLVRLCDLVVTADPGTAETFRPTGVPVEVIYNYPRLELFRPRPARVEEIRNRYPGRTLIVYHGSMGEDRGLFHMIRAMARVKSQRPGVLLLLIGLAPGSLHDKARALIGREGVEEQVEIIPWVHHEEIVDWLYACSAGLVPFHPVPKWFKNIPIKLFEYMACGLPMVMGNVPPLAQYVREAGAGVVVDATRVDELAEGILSLLSDEGARRQMSDAGKRAVAERWSWAAMERRLIERYRQLLESP